MCKSSADHNLQGLARYTFHSSQPLLGLLEASIRNKGAGICQHHFAKQPTDKQAQTSMDDNSHEA